MIRRTREGCLDLRDGKWYLESWSKENGFLETDKLFTGLIICEDEGRINEVSYKHEVKICKEGEIIGDYTTHPYFSKLIDFKSALKISYGMIEINEDWEPNTYYGETFNGIAYLENEDKDGFSYIDEERLYMEGIESVILKYFKDGSLKALNFEYRFNLSCSEPNRIKFLSIDEDYFKQYPKLKQSVLEDDVIEDASSFRRFKAHKRVFFSGAGVNDEIFNNIWSNRGMDAVEELIIRGNNLTKHSFYKLLDLLNLKEVSMEFESKTMSEDAIESGKFVAKELKEKGVTVKLKINGKERAL